MTTNHLKFGSAKGLLDKALALTYFHPDKEDGQTAIPFHRSNGRSKLIVVVGDNASGKSFFRRIIQLLCQKNKVECIALSVEARSGGSHMYGPLRAMIYGDESWQSTGVLSSHTVTTGIKTCRGRDRQHVIFWDEPDLGLSESWAAGVGQAICQFTRDCPKKTVAAVVVTHSRPLVARLLPAKPVYLHLGCEPSEAPQTLQEWLDRPIVPRDLEDLSDESHKRFKLIQRILNEAKP